MIYLLKSFHGFTSTYSAKDIDESMDEEVF